MEFPGGGADNQDLKVLKVGLLNILNLFYCGIPKSLADCPGDFSVLPKYESLTNVVQPLYIPFNILSGFCY